MVLRGSAGHPKAASPAAPPAARMKMGQEWGESCLVAGTGLGMAGNALC